MKRFTSLLSSEASFRTQLLTTLTLGMLVLALAASLTNAWLTNRQAQERMIAQGERITATLARQSVLALLYGSGENARDFAASTLAFPDVRNVRILDRDRKVLLEIGHGSATPFPTLELDNPNSSAVRDTADAWHFFAPVFTHDQGGENGEEALYGGSAGGRAELLGHVHVEMGKASLRDMERAVLANNLATALGHRPAAGGRPAPPAAPFDAPTQRTLRRDAAGGGAPQARPGEGPRAEGDRPHGTGLQRDDGGPGGT
ncbi:hypothetical protein [Endothiovibrio diazotrophicus]